MAETATIVCTACLRDDHTVDAVKYCLDCNENMCKPCLRLHLKASPMSPHRLIGRDDIPAWLRPTTGAGEEMCTRHPDNVLTKFCVDHGMLCCGECEELEHSCCSSVISVKEAAESHDASNKHSTLARGLRQLAGQLAHELGNRRELQVGGRRSTAHALATVRQIRQRANDLCDELEKKAIDEINSECIDNDNRLESDISDIEAMTTVLDVGIKQVESSCESSLQTLLRFQRGKRVQTDAEKLLKEIKASKVNNPKEFTINPIVSTFLDKTLSMGGFASKSDPCLKLGSNREVHVRNASDTSECDIRGVEVMRDGSVVMVDQENEKIKLLTARLDLQEDGWLQLCGAPYAVCSTGPSEVAVSIPTLQLVQVLAVTPTFVIEGNIQVGAPCRGLAYSHLYDELYVACGGGSLPGEGLGQVRVYNKAGTLSRTFKVDKSGKPVTTQPMHLAISNDGSNIHVADAVKGLVTLDRQGTVLSTFTTLELEDAHGVCVDVNNNVIVCGHKSDNVLQVGKSGHDYTVLAGEADGIRHPTSVCYDVRTASLVVTNALCDTLQVFLAK